MRQWTAQDIANRLERRGIYISLPLAEVISDIINTDQIEALSEEIPEAKPDPLIEGLPVVLAPGWKAYLRNGSARMRYGDSVLDQLDACKDEAARRLLLGVIR